MISNQFHLYFPYKILKQRKMQISLQEYDQIILTWIQFNLQHILYTVWVKKKVRTRQQTIQCMYDITSK